MLLIPLGMRAEDQHELPGPATNAVCSPWSGSASVIIMSKYYGTIFGGTFYEGPMTFSDLVISHKDKAGVLTFDLSIGQKLDRLNQYNRDGGNEYDLTVDHTLTLGSGCHQLILDGGVCFLALHDLKKLHDDAFEEFLRVDVPIRIDPKSERPLIQAYVEPFHYHRMGDGMHNEGWWLYWGAFRDQSLGCKLFGKPLVLNVDYRMGVSAGAYNSRSGIEYHRLALSLPVSLGNHWTITPSLIGQLQGGPHQTFVHNDEPFGTLFIKYAF